MLAVAGGCSTLLIMGLIGFFLVYKAIDPLREAGWHFLTTFEWIPDGIPDQTGPLFGIGAMLFGHAHLRHSRRDHRGTDLGRRSAVHLALRAPEDARCRSPRSST